MKNKILYKVEKFENIRDMINRSAELYSENTAFKIKHKNGKEIMKNDNNKT